MRPMPILEDTIAAIATAPGAGGLAVVRVSGPRALAVADAVFRGGSPLATAPSHTLHHGWAVWPEAAGTDRETGGGPPGYAPPLVVSGGALTRASSALLGSRSPSTPPAGPRPSPDPSPPAGAGSPGTRRLDEVVAAVFRGPRSYTCEDVVEI